MKSPENFVEGRVTILNRIYWLLPLLLVWLQYLVVAAGMRKIAYEELAESVRNVFWLQHRLVYDGMSSNVGWYGVLLIVYKIFGFSLFKAKFVRLILHLIALYCSADLLRRRFGIRTAIVPLLVIGLSPTLLYFNTLQTSFGIDMPCAAICLWLLLSVRFQAAKVSDLVKIFLTGMLAMMAAMSYPTFLLYWPSLFFVAVYRWKQNSALAPAFAGKGAYIFWGLCGFLLPLVTAFLFVRDRQLLIYDPVSQAGLFRGGGQFGFDAGWFKDSVVVVLGDLFRRGNSYYFHLTRPEFSGWLAPIGLCLVWGTVIHLLAKEKKERVVLLAALLLLFVNLILPNFSVGGSAGLRRCTGILAAWFVFFALAWNFYLNAEFENPWRRRIGIFVCLLFPLSSALKFPSVLSDTAKPTITHEIGDDALVWFAKNETPSASLKHFLETTEKGEALSLSNSDGSIVAGRYQEIYAAIAGYRNWNGLPEIEIRAWDSKAGTNVTLTPSFWTEAYRLERKGAQRIELRRH